jgi:hypothetical protein
VTTGGSPSVGVLGLSKTNHSQFVYTASYLVAAGLTAGNYMMQIADGKNSTIIPIIKN